MVIPLRSTILLLLALRFVLAGISLQLHRIRSLLPLPLQIPSIEYIESSLPSKRRRLALWRLCCLSVFAPRLRGVIGSEAEPSSACLCDLLAVS